MADTELSSRHHYIPQLYIKGFCGDDGKISVYDKQSMKILPQRRPPRSMFWEQNRNISKIEGQNVDIIEKTYGTFETQWGPVFKVVRGEIPNESIDSKIGRLALKQFMASLYWRSPSIDSWADEYIKTIDLTRMGKPITINGKPLAENDKFVNQLRVDKEFRYYFRCFFLPLLTFNYTDGNDKLLNWNILRVEREEKNKHISSDFPFVFNDLNMFFNFNGNFLFPLSSDAVLLSTQKVIDMQSLPDTAWAITNILSFAFSDRYICCGSEDYLRKVSGEYYIAADKIDKHELLNALFDKLPYIG
ncbi:MAG: DUF4238 domain-containing protein [Opitutales bacterium]|jgi:hypothetical protein